MINKYPAKFSDEFGDEKTTIYNDGKCLRMVVRDVEFIGSDFHGFDPVTGTDEAKLKQFNLFLGELCAYVLDCEIPILVISNDRIFEEKLHAHIEYGEPVETGKGTTIHRRDGSIVQDPHHQIRHEVLHFQLTFQGRLFKTSGKVRYASFDEQLTELQALLPPAVYLKICWNCAFSDYSPAGSGVFGNMACFRDCKAAYQAVKTKKELFEIWSKRAEDVQEIYLCSEFEKRPSGIGGLYMG